MNVYTQIPFPVLSDSGHRFYNGAMANGEEDLREKNRGRRTEAGEKRYSRWSSSLGREDAEMLLEKADRAPWPRKRKSEWNDED